MDDIGFEQTSKSACERLECEHRALARFKSLLIVCSFAKAVDDLVLLDCRNTKAFDDTGKPVRRTTASGIRRGVGELVEKPIYQL